MSEAEGIHELAFQLASNPQSLTSSIKIKFLLTMFDFY